MNLDFARGLFLIASLGVASLCAAAWHEPDTGVVSGANGLGYCPLPPQARRELQAQLQPDEDLLLFMYSLSQGLGQAR